MQAIRIQRAFASAAKIASRCRLKDAGDPAAAENAKQPDAPKDRKKRTLENNPAKSYKTAQNAANRTPKRRINAEHVQQLDQPQSRLWISCPGYPSGTKPKICWTSRMLDLVAGPTSPSNPPVSYPRAASARCKSSTSCFDK